MHSQDTPMDDLRASLIQQLSVYSDNEEGFLRHVDHLAGTQGDRIFSILLNIFTQLDFNYEEAPSIWRNLVKHRRMMMDSMDRPVNLTTAICDYMLTVKKALHQPKVVELNLFEETHHYSKCDRLTGLFNRTYFEEALKSEASRCRRYQSEFSLVFFDLDHFKNINDTLGHLAGDSALKAIANLILSEKRAEDIAARFGGEEIVLILPGTQKFSAMIIAERIRHKIEYMNLYFEEQMIQVTVSGGIATYPLDTDIEGELVDCADRALFRAKHRGRNQIVLFSDDKRHDVRMDWMGPIKIQELGTRILKRPAMGRIKDLSLSGVRFESDQPIKMGSRIQLEVPLLSGDPPLVVVGQVTRLNPSGSGYDVGAAFLHFGEQDRAAIHKQVAGLLPASTASSSC